jgi:predicted membrane protein
MIKRHKYVTNTWLLAQAFYTILHYLYFIVPDSIWRVFELPLFMGMSMAFSFPGYIVSILLFNRFKTIERSIHYIMFLIILTAAIIIWGSLAIVARLMFHPDDFIWIMECGILPFIAALVSIFIRYKQLIKTLKLNIHETLFP